jgi:hypothetical protein
MYQSIEPSYNIQIPSKLQVVSFPKAPLKSENIGDYGNPCSTRMFHLWDPEISAHKRKKIQKLHTQTQMSQWDEIIVNIWITNNCRPILPCWCRLDMCVIPNATPKVEIKVL